MRPIFLAGLLLMGAPVAAAAPLSDAEWRADIEALKQGIVEMHPAPYHTVSQADLFAGFGRLADEAGTRSDAEMIAGLTELVAMLGEGHSRLVIPIAGFGWVGAGHTADEAPRIAPLAYVPIQLMRADTDFVVIRAAAGHADLLGARLEAIDGIPVAELAERIAPLVNADSPAERRTRTGDFMMLPALLRARGLPTGTRWTLISPADERIDVDLDPVDQPVEWTGALPYPAAPADAPSPVNWVAALGDGRILLRLAEIRDQDGMTMTELAAETDRLISAEAEPALIVDLRGNPGGDNSQIDSIVRLAIRDTRLWAPGRLFVLIDGRTFSAAMNLANALDKWTPAIFVGSPTAASPNSYGDARPLELPNSGLSARIATLYWQDGGPMDQRESISPEIAAPFTQAAILENRDPALETIGAILDAPAGAAGTFTGTAAMSGYDLPVTMALAGHHPTLEIAGLTTEPVAIDALDIGADGSLEARMTVAGTTIPLQGRIAGDWLVGHVSVRGRIYAIALRRSPFLPVQ